MDIAIKGRGFFQIKQSDGAISYTRDGTFHLNANGEMVTAGGLSLVPAVVVPNDAVTFAVGQNGNISISMKGNAASRSQIADFINSAGLQAIGNNLLSKQRPAASPG